MLLLKLFWSFFQIGIFSIGGGYASLPLIQQEIVYVRHWMTITELVDVIAISQMTPGPIALNAATFVGVRLNGIIGGIVATMGYITPSSIIAVFLARYFFRHREMKSIQGVLKGLRPAVVALIAAAGLSILSNAVFKISTSSWFDFSFSNIDFIAIGIFLLSLIAIRKLKANILLVMGVSGAIGILIYQVIL